MRLNLSQISNPHILENFKSQGISIGDISGPVTLELADGEITLPIRHAIVHFIFWRNFHEFNIPIRLEHVMFTSGVCSKSIISKLQSQAYKELIILYPEKEDLIIDRIWRTINEYNQFILIELREWHSSLDILSLVKMMNESKVKEICNVDIITPELGTDVIESLVANKNSQLIEVLAKRGSLKHNILLDYLESQLLNVNQLQQMFISLGVRTDVDDMIVLYPIKSCVMQGLQNVCEYVVESLSAKKSLFYNHVAVKNSQYFSRKQSLATSAIRHIYPGNCGSTLTIPFTITTKNHRNIIGVNILDEDGIHKTLTGSNITKYIDKTVNIFSPLTCRYTDGVCEHCGGLLTKYIPNKLTIGVMSSILVLSQVTQLILSSKHFVKTKSIIYKLSTEASAYLIKKNNEIYWKKEIWKVFDDLKIGIMLKDMKHLSDLNLISEDSNTTEERFSRISTLVLKINNEEDIILPLTVEKGVPHFSMEMLYFMKNILKDIATDESMYWIPLKGFNHNEPIFRTIVANDSMMDYVKRASAFLQVDIEKYTNLQNLLHDFSDIIYSKVNVNILHLAIMLKAYLVSSKYDYRVPIVKDINDIKLTTNPKCLKFRSESIQMSFQQIVQHLSSPGTYLIPTSPSIMDRFFDL